MFTDGVHLAGYLGSSPALRADPLGLFGYIEGLNTGMQMADLASNMMDGAFTGVLAGLGLILMTNEYSAYVDTAMYWAEDWRQPDDAYARSASWAEGIGYWADEEGSSSGGRGRIPALLAGYHDHHGFPQEFRDQFKAMGIDIDDPKFKARLKDAYHLRVVHGRNKGGPGGAFNQFWRGFLEQTENMQRTTRRARALAALVTLRQNAWRVPTRMRTR